MLNPLQVAERALGIGARVAGGALNVARGALGRRPEAPADDAAGSPESGRQAPPKPQLTDTALARKVESELFRDSRVPKGKIDVNAVERVVYLRGEAKTPEMVNDLERLAAAIPEVERVENLLHLPKTPAPTRTDTPPTQRKTRRTKGTAPARKRSPATKVNAERHAAKAEPTPRQAAAKRAGRKPAPMGSSGESTAKAGATESAGAGGEASKGGETTPPNATKPAPSKATKPAPPKEAKPAPPKADEPSNAPAEQATSPKQGEDLGT